jgi:hypothetical protein
MELRSTTEDLFIPLKPLFFITRIFGLTNTKSYNGEYKITFQHIALVGLWTVAFLVGTIYSVSFVPYDDHTFPKKVNVTIIADHLVLFSTTIVTLITFSVNRRNIPDILRKLTNIDGLINHERRMDIYKKTKREVVFQVVTLSIIVFVLLLPPLNIFSNGTLAWIFSNITQILSLSLNITTVLIYTNIIRMVKYIYKNILDLFEIYFKGVDMRTFNTTNRFEVTSSGDIELGNTGRASLQLLPNQSKHLQKLRWLYIEMYDTVQLITSHFGVPILFHILSVMVSCVVSFYSAFHIINSAATNSEGVTTYILSCYLLFWGTVYVIPFVWLVISCDEAALDGNRGVIYIQRVKASPHMGHGGVTELEKLSSQLKDMKVQFSVCGLFVLNLPFLCTFLGGIFTYFIIMVQIN